VTGSSRCNATSVKIAPSEMIDREPEGGSLDPGAIEVGAAVLVAYRIVSPKPA